MSNSNSSSSSNLPISSWLMDLCKEGLLDREINQEGVRSLKEGAAGAALRTLLAHQAWLALLPAQGPTPDPEARRQGRLDVILALWKFLKKSPETVQ